MASIEPYSYNIPITCDGKLSNRSRIFNAMKFLISLGMAAALVWIYQFDIAESNAYYGYVKIDLGFSYLATVTVGMLFLSVINTRNITLPSDIFLAVYSLFILWPFFILAHMRGQLNFVEAIQCFSILALPALIIARPLSISINLLRVPRFSEGAIYGISAVAIAVAVLAASQSSITLSFSFESSYARRQTARELFPAGSVLAYANILTMNGLTPLIAYAAGYLRRRLLLLLAVTLSLAYFAIIGAKAPLLYALIATVFGVILRRYSPHRFFLLFAAGTLGLLLFALMEEWVTGYSYVADYFLRRAFTVPTFNNLVYLQFIFGEQWAWFNGAGHIDQPVTFLIGESVLGRDGLNANTNAFLYALASGGIMVYSITLALTYAIFSVLNAQYKQTGNTTLQFIALLFSFLLLEQAVTTVLISSGLILLIILSFFVILRRRSQTPPSHHPESNRKPC